MESTVPVVRFVKCPKCLKILTEFAEVPVYKCGGCGVILRAKAHSSTISAGPASKNLSDIDPLSSELANLGEKTNLDGEKSLESEQIRVNNVPDSEDSVEVEQSSEVNPEANDSPKTIEKLNGMELSTTSEEDIFKISHAYDGSASSTDEDIKDRISRKYLLSRRTHRSKYMSDSLDSTEAAENSSPDIQAIEQDYTFASHAPFRSSKDAQVKIIHRSSEQEDQVKILSKVDELRNELRGLFNETAIDKAFIEKVPSKEYRSSLIPFSRHNKALPFHLKSSTINQGPQDLKYKAPRSQSMVRLCRPVSGGAPFVICYKCFELLQLPADFLVSPKKVHKLQCGACLQVLMFSFRPRSHSKPHTPEEFQHPPSEEIENMSLFEQINGWDQISTSDSSYFSFAKTNSIEVEHSLNKSRSFDGIVEEDVGRHAIGSRLHNLLGYSSARQLLFNTDYSSDRRRSTDSDTPSFYRPSGRRRWVRR